VSLRKGCVGVGGCPWRVLLVREASRGSWRGAVKNDRNFSGGYAYAVAAPLAPSGGLGQKNRPARPGLCPIRATAVSNPCPIRWPAQSQQAIWGLAYLLRPQVLGLWPAIRTHTTVRQCGLGGIAVQVLSAYDLHMLLLSVHPASSISSAYGFTSHPGAMISVAYPYCELSQTGPARTIPWLMLRESNKQPTQ
jgi:hypothetical protein